MQRVIVIYLIENVFGARTHYLRQYVVIKPSIQGNEVFIM